MWYLQRLVKNVETEAAPIQKRTRGSGRGGNFFVLGRPVWERLWTVSTVNRLNLVTAYFVVLAGTGSDHTLSKWSAKACEEHAGLGKPRAKVAIEELVSHGLLGRTEASTLTRPQYILPAKPLENDPIFLPVQLITGLENETPMLRRVRETGDALLLRMLIDLYGMIQLDATHGIPLANLHRDMRQPYSRKVCEVGAHALWALETEYSTSGGGGDWVKLHHQPKIKDPKEAWAAFWERLATLKKIGAIIYDPWVFDSEALDAEPMIPVDPGVLYGSYVNDDVGELTNVALEAARALVGDRTYLLDRYANNIIVPLAGHRQAPVLREVVRLRVEADTPGRRLSYAKRKERIETHRDGFDQLKDDAEAGCFDRPMKLAARVEAF